MQTATPKRQLAEELLDQPLSEYVQAKRQARPRWSWRLIAAQLNEDTGGKLEVTGQTLRTWYAEPDRAAS